MKGYAFLLLALLLLVPAAWAAAPAPQVSITSQPSSINNEQDYSITFSITDDDDDRVNITTLLYRNNTNILNVSSTNQSTESGSNSYTVTLLKGNYSATSTLRANITVVEHDNSTQTNFSASNTVYVNYAEGDSSGATNALSSLMVIALLIAVLGVVLVSMKQTAIVEKMEIVWIIIGICMALTLVAVFIASL